MRDEQLIRALGELRREFPACAPQAMLDSAFPDDPRTSALGRTGSRRRGPLAAGLLAASLMLGSLLWFSGGAMFSTLSTRTVHPWTACFARAGQNLADRVATGGLLTRPAGAPDPVRGTFRED